jgi:hypothetical protein
MRFLNKYYRLILENNKVLFTVLWMSSFVICLPAYKAGFNADFEGLLDYFTKYDFIDFVNSKDFNVKSLYQATHFQLYFLIKYFGHQPIPWFLLLTLLHTTNGYLAYQLFKKVMQDFNVKLADQIAFWGSLLFILNPNITEITIWKASYHYLVGVIFQFIILIQLKKLLLHKKASSLVIIYTIYFISTYTLEIFYLTPWYVLIFIIGYYWKGFLDKQQFKKSILFVFIPLMLMFFAHLLVFKYATGSWIAHYGTVGEFRFISKEILPKFLEYTSTLLLLTPHVPYNISSSIFDFANTPIVYYASYCVVIILSLTLILRFRRLTPNGQIFTLLFGMFMFGIAINSSIYFDNVFQMYNSRRCYFIGPFFYYMLVLMLFSLISNIKFRNVILIVLAALYSLLSIKKSWHWRKAAKIQYAMLNKYRWKNEDTVIILNMPTYYQDVRVLHTSNEVLWNESLKVLGCDTVTGKVYTAAAYNMINAWDGAHVVMQDSMTMKVTLNQWGSWWMYNYLGATNYENELFRCEFNNSRDYLIYFKKSPNNFTVIFQQGDEWRVVDTKKGVNEEQW